MPREEDDDLIVNNEIDNDDEGTGTPAPATAPEVKLGDQEDGSFVVEDEDEKPVTPPTENVDDTGESEEELAAKREARRLERHERKQRQREQQERVRRELQAERDRVRQLEERLAAVERKSSGAEMAQLEAVEKQTRQAYNHFKDKIREGQENGDGQMVADATEKMMLAGQRLQQLDNIKKSYSQRQNQPAPLDERLVTNANTFMAKHNWFKPDGRDNDSVVLRALDNQVAAEGWDPTSEAYWNELESRIKKYLPHRSKGGKVATNEMDDDGGEEDETPRAKPKSTVAGSGREAAASAGAKNTFRLSPERVQALKDAGMWDDPKERTEAIKRYREYDKQQKGR